MQQQFFVLKASDSTNVSMVAPFWPKINNQACGNNQAPLLSYVHAKRLRS